MKLTTAQLTGLAVATVLSVANPVSAAPITTLYNTGVDSSGNLLADGSLNDPHYTLTSVAAGSTQTRIITAAGDFPIGPWLADNAVSRWIGPNNHQDLLSVPGTYVFKTTFDLTGFDFTTASISGKWSTDNEGMDIKLNGVSLGITNLNGPVYSFQKFTPFTIASGFHSGLNTLEFVIDNANNFEPTSPTGLRVELTGTANLTAVPVPSAALLFGTGVFTMTGAAFRRKNISA